ncbi:hypothetical protein D3C85_1298670 [compost metagenome]
MRHEPIDHEVSDLMKKATAETKEGNYVLAIELVKKSLNKIKKSNLLYSHSSYTKIIPYYQKAGLYSEVEKFCLDELVPSIRVAFQNGMSQRCQEIQEVHFYQYISKIYDKLRLAAKRESKPDDENRFIREYAFYESKWKELQPVAQKTELAKEYKEMKKVFGADTSLWPDVIKNRFESLL